MIMRASLTLILGGALLAGCGAGRNAPITQERAAGVGWRDIATAVDRERLRNWRPTWLAAFAEARAADPTGVAREGALFVGDRALPDALPPAGAYRCRTFKLGARSARTRGFAVFPYFGCHVAVEDGVVNFAKNAGSQRPSGVIFPDGNSRGVFLGTLVLGDETNPVSYGRDPNRDLAGFVERVGERRWRMVLPEPRFESRLDVIELVPAD